MTEIQTDEEKIIADEAERFRLALMDFGVQLQPESAREFIMGVEQRLLEQTDSIINLRVKHMHPDGMYVRTIEVPAGSLITSEEHTTEHPFVIHTGSISVWTPHEGFQTLHAPYLGVTAPGTKRILFSHTDVVWSTFHATTKKDLKEIRQEILRSGDQERTLS